MQLLVDTTPQPARHPAKYTDSLIPVMGRMVRGCRRILDPFAGTGKIFLLNKWYPDMQIEAIEIEPEWAMQHPLTTVGNALELPWTDCYFDAVATSCTYANRMADSHVARDASRRNTYTHALGRKLHPDNSGQMQWGARYRDFHVRAWTEVRRVLPDGGTFVLNIKDHIRAGRRVRVTDWHIETLEMMGFTLAEHERVECTGNGFGQNAHERVPFESVIRFKLAK